MLPASNGGTREPWREAGENSADVRMSPILRRPDQETLGSGGALVPLLASFWSTKKWYLQTAYPQCMPIKEMVVGSCLIASVLPSQLNPLFIRLAREKEMLFRMPALINRDRTGSWINSHNATSKSTRKERRS